MNKFMSEGLPVGEALILQTYTNKVKNTCIVSLLYKDSRRSTLITKDIPNELIRKSIRSKILAIESETRRIQRYYLN